MDIDAIIDESLERGFAAAGCSSAQEDELRNMIQASDVSQLKLDDQERMGYTFLCAACSFVTLKRIHSLSASPLSSMSIEDAMNSIIQEGGDADTNACVAGAIIGCL